MQQRAPKVPSARLRIIVLCLSMVLASTALAQPLAPLDGSWTELAPYPIAITNNAVTSVCTDQGCTLYSFMGMTDPFDGGSVTAASYKLTSPGTGPW